MTNDRCRAVLQSQLATPTIALPQARPQPTPLQTPGAVVVRRARFSSQSIEAVARSGQSGRDVISLSMMTPLTRTSGGVLHLSPEAARVASERSLAATVQRVQSPYLAVDPQRADYFQAATRAKQSYRAAVNLMGVVVGRVFITFGTGGLIQGFAPHRSLGPGLVPMQPADGPGDGGIVVHHVAVGAALTVLGSLMAYAAITSFVTDTYKLGPRRALVVGSISYTGISCVIAASVLYVYGQAEDSLLIRYLSLLPRVVGNFCLFYAVTNSFPSSELVHGNVPLPNREQFRLVVFASGGAMMILWAYLGTSSQNAPIWAREISKALGISGLHIGASLSRTDAMRFASDVRTLQSPPSHASPTA